MKKYVIVVMIFLTILFLLVMGVSALELGAKPQTTNANIFWAKVYGDANSNHLPNISSTSDGGYITIAWVEDRANSDYDSWILKLDDQGSVTWQTNFENNFILENLNSILPTSDGGFIAAGSIGSLLVPNSGDGWVVKLNSAGSIVWQKKYGGSLTDQFYSIIETSDHEYLVVGETQSFGVGGVDIWALKLNADGSIEWENTYGGADAEYGLKAVRAGNDGFMIAGLTSSSGAGGSDFWILKLNPDGTTVWQKAYGGILDEYFSALIEVDGGYLVGGSSENSTGSELGWLLKLNPDGSIAWQKSYGGNTEFAEDIITSLVETGTGDYLVAGLTESFGAGREDAWVFKINPTGDVLWEKTYGGTNSDIGRDILITDNGILLAGKTKSFGAGGFDLWLLNLDRTGNLSGCEGIGESALVTTDTLLSAADTTVSDIASSASMTDVTDTPNNNLIPPQQVCWVEIETFDLFLPFVIKH